MDILALISHIDYQTYWGVFFIGILIAITAMSTGVDGAMFWGPVLLIVYKVDPAVAVACAIFIELCGFSSGLYGYAKKKKVKYRQASFLLLFTIPTTILGAYVSKIVPASILIFTIGIACVFLIFSNLWRVKSLKGEQGSSDFQLKHKGIGRLIGSIGAFFDGAIGVGMGEVGNYYFLIKNKYPVTFATGTTVFMVAMTNVASTLFNILYYNQFSAKLNFSQVFSILVFAIPAVVIGARLGVLLAHTFKKREYFAYYLATVFTVMAAISFYRVSLMVDEQAMLASIVSALQ